MMVFTDGSFSRKPNIAGIGYVILYNSREIQGGKYYFNCQNNNVAEIMAIYYALKYIDEHNFLDKTVQILTDSEYAIRKIRKNYKNDVMISNNDYEEKMIEYIQSFETKTRKKLSVMFIKGHVHDGTKFSYYNNLADGIAKEQRLLGIKNFNYLKIKKTKSRF